MAETLEARLQRIEDIQAITELKAAYCNAADGGWDRPTHDADAVAALFVEDGVWEGGASGRGVGREEIRKLFDGFKPAPFAFHRVSNPIIQVHGDRASGEWHVLVAITFEGDKHLWIGGVYNDTFVRTPRGWRFKHLKFTQAFRTRNAEGWKVPKSDVLDTAIIPAALSPEVADHARRYLASNGRDGHLTMGGTLPPFMQNIPSLLLVTRGRSSGKHYLMPLYCGSDGERYVVIASKGGAPVHPGWYKNLVAHPRVRIQVGEKRMDAIASIASGDERERLWAMMEKQFPSYGKYRQKAGAREIPVVVLTPVK
jgi:proline iminopeptidase